MKDVFVYLALAAANAPWAFCGGITNTFALGFILAVAFCRLVDLNSKAHRLTMPPTP